MEDIYCLVMFSISYQFNRVYYNEYVSIIFLNIYWEGIKILLPVNGTAIKNFIAGVCYQYQATLIDRAFAGFSQVNLFISCLDMPALSILNIKSLRM